MKKIVLIVPYFGRFPNYFQLWLNSCKNNKTIDFILFTDQDMSIYEIPANVKIISSCLKEIKEKYAQKLGFEVELNRAYKLCDLRPSYGEIFCEYLNGYDYWGHCDIDLVFGDIRKYVTENVLLKNERIYPQGYFSLYKNSKQVNSYYSTLNSKSRLNWKEVFKSKRNWCFDEWAGHLGGGITQIMYDNGIPMYLEIDEADIDPDKGYFKGPNILENSFFEYDNGKLFNISKNEKKEVLLMHFQRRNIVIDKDINMNHFYFVDPYYMTSDDSLLLKNRSIDRMKQSINYFFDTAKRKIKRDIFDK